MRRVPAAAVRGQARAALSAWALRPGQVEPAAAMPIGVDEPGGSTVPAGGP